MAFSNPSAPLILLVLLVALLLCTVLARRFWQRRNVWQQDDAVWPLYARRPRCGPEQLLYLRLVQALPEHTVLAGVALADVLAVKRGFDTPTWQRRLRHLQYSFVVCAKDATVLAAIELDHATHTRARPNRREQMKVRASAAAGVRLVRWPSRTLPDAAAIRVALGEPPLAFYEDTAPHAQKTWWPTVVHSARQPARD